MRFLMLVKADKAYEAGEPPNPKLMAAMGPLIEETMRSGKLLMTAGLTPSSDAHRIYAANQTLTVKDGPFSETKELIGGFAIMQLDSHAQAIEEGKRFMSLHLEALGPGYEGQLEIRQIVGPEDMG